jgi:signal transduction histidine kinase
VAILTKNRETVSKGRLGSFGSPDRVGESAGPKGEELEAESSRANGLAGLSHELRNLLTALNLYSELLAEPGVLTLPHRHMAEEIKLITRAGKCLLDTMNRLPEPASGVPLQSVSDILAASAGDDASGQMTAIVSEHQLAPVLDSCLPLLAHLAGPQVHVHLRCARNHGSLPISSEDLTLILVNLVRNAVEAMPCGGGVWIAIQPAVKSAHGPAKCARIVVEDDGPGIPVKVRAHLFDGGYTTKKSFHEDQKVGLEHHGLGLAIVRRQVESAGGVIHLAASGRGGARFEIRIPVPAIKVQPKLQMSGTTNCKEQTTHKKEPE